MSEPNPRELLKSVLAGPHDVGTGIAAHAAIFELEALRTAGRQALATLDLIAQPGYAFTEWPASDLQERRAQRAAAQTSADALRAALAP